MMAAWGLRHIIRSVMFLNTHKAPSWRFRARMDLRGPENAALSWWLFMIPIVSNIERA